MDRRTTRRLICRILPHLALMAGSAACAPVTAPASAIRQCNLSYSPDGAHVAYFDWRGGASVEAVVCSGGCETVVTTPVARLSGYRWSGPNRIDIILRGSDRQDRTTRIGTLSVHVLSTVGGGQPDAGIVRFNRRSCTPIENVVVEDPEQ